MHPDNGLVAMPVVECSVCHQEEQHPFEAIQHESYLSKPYQCPKCVDYTDALGYHELRALVSAHGVSVGSNPTEKELVEALKCP